MPRLHLDVARRVAAGVISVRGTPRRREAVRITLRDADGGIGLGEAMPLPGYSRDDAAGAEQALAAIAACAREGGLALPDALTDAAAGGAAAVRGRHPHAALLDATLAPHAAWLDPSPGARFALECALVDLLARRAEVSAAQWLADGRALQPVRVSLLLPDDDTAACAAAAQAVAEGFRVLKLKIARADRPPEREDALLAALRATADAAREGDGEPVRLRLDANGALDPSQATGRLAQLEHFGIELVEEPVSGPALLGLPLLPLPWAADESLADAALTAALLALPPGRRPAALVLKPAQLGLSRCLRLAEAAAERGLGVIVSHSFDGDLGHAAACALAAALPLRPWPCGLAPHPGLRGPLPARPWLPVPVAPGLGVSDEGESA